MLYNVCTARPSFPVCLVLGWRDAELLFPVIMAFIKTLKGVIPDFLRDKIHALKSSVLFVLNTILSHRTSDVKEGVSSGQFVPLSSRSFVRRDGDCKLIAFYLPQFHAIELNDKNFGRGFTEWQNVAKATPQFPGHYQPHVPIDVGFYDLSHEDVMFRQIELAKQYGLYGFCFHYYWFSGHRLLEKPLFNWLNNKELDFPFCLCWANENWSTLWDGGNREVIMKQELTENDFERFWTDIKMFFEDKRYIKVNGCPLLVIYRPSLFENKLFLKFIDSLKEMALRDGFNGLLILRSNFSSSGTSREWGCDGTVQFPPHGILGYVTPMFNPGFTKRNNMGRVDLTAFLKDTSVAAAKLPDNEYRCAFPSWDNTARKCHSGGCVFSGITPESFSGWLKECIIWTRTHHDEDHQFVFINAWNEWGEGAHLEPDTRYGYAHLKAVRDALEECR